MTLDGVYIASPSVGGLFFLLIWSSRCRKKR